MSKASQKAKPNVLTGGWSRITFHLPARTPKEIAAIKLLLAYLRTHYDGYTASNVRPSAFTGMWKEKDLATGAVNTHDDGIMLLMLDVEIDINDVMNLDRSVFLMRQLIHFYYSRAKCPQKEFWITVQPLWLAL